MSIETATYDPTTHTTIPREMAEALYQIIERVRDLDAAPPVVWGSGYVVCDECDEETFAEIECEADTPTEVAEILREIQNSPQIALWLAQMATRPQYTEYTASATPFVPSRGIQGPFG